MRLNLGVQHSDWLTIVSNAVLHLTSYNVGRCSTTSETSAQHILVAAKGVERVNWRSPHGIVALGIRNCSGIKFAMF
jgi:hypothetical protein